MPESDLTKDGRGDMRAFVLASIGMSFLWPFLREYSFFGLILPKTSDGDSNRYFIVFLAVIAVAAVVCVICRARVVTLVRRRRWIVPAVATVSSLGILAIIATGGGSAADAVSYSVMGVLAICFITLLLGWTDFFLSDVLDLKSMMVCITVSFILSALVGYLVYLSRPFDYIRPLVIPAASGWLWYALRYVPAQADECSRRILFDDHGDRDLLWPIILMFVFIIGTSFIVGTYHYGSINFSVVPTSALGITAILFFGIVLLLFLLKSSDSEKAIYVSWIAIAALLIVSILVTTIVAPELRRYFQRITTSGSVFAEFFLYLILMACIRRRRYPHVLSITCLYVVPLVIARFITYCVVPALVAESGLSFDQIADSLALTIASVLILCVFFFMGLMILIPASRGTAGGVLGGDDGPAGSSRSGDEVFLALATRYGLSQRETDVLRVLSQGHTFSKAAEELLLSESTVQAHAKSLYRKLDVHSKQELIDLVDAEGKKAK